MHLRLVRLALLPLVGAGCVAPRLTETAPVSLPESGLIAYTGDDDEAGDLYAGITELANAETGQVCVLVPMVHIADAAFYEAVQTELEAADVVLTEGVHGVPSLAPVYALGEYLLAQYPRWASRMGLTQQEEALEWRDTWRNADVSWWDLQSQMPWWSPMTQAIALPLIVVFYEPRYVFEWLTGPLVDLFGGDASTARARHRLAQAVEEEGGGAVDALVPGVVDFRNEHLLASFDRVVAADGVRRIAIPWGAAHFEPLLEELSERGFEPSGHRWVRAISVRALLAGDGQGDEADDFAIPYLVHWRDHGPAWSLALLASSIAAGTSADGTTRFSLLWKLLLSVSSNDDTDAFCFQLLPSLFGRPLLFEYASDEDSARVRFLLLFEVGEL